jgi:hypothetical protein
MMPEQPGPRRHSKCRITSMIGRLRTVVLDAADMEAEAQFRSALLDIPVVHRSDDWTTLAL